MSLIEDGGDHFMMRVQSLDGIEVAAHVWLLGRPLRMVSLLPERLYARVG